MGCSKLTYQENEDANLFCGLWKKSATEKNRVDYYAFGLTFNSYNRENSLANQFKYNGKEEQDELSLAWLDYGAREYMPEVGRFTRIDNRADNYMMYSPYGYVANNPVNSIDFNGDFILPAQFREKFKRLTQYLQHGIQGILGNKKIVNALKKHGGFSDAQLKEAFTWNKGPTVEPLKMDPKEDGFTGGQKGNHAPLFINIDLVESLEKAKGKDRDYWLFMVGLTILHETTHWGYIENELTTKTAEEGDDFENDAYGEVVKWTKGGHKRVMDNWLNTKPTPSPMMPAKNTNSGGAGGGFGLMLYFFNNTSGTSSGSSGKKTDSIYHPHKFHGQE